MAHRSTFHAARAAQGSLTRTVLLVGALLMIAAIAAQQWTTRDVLRSMSSQVAFDHGRRIALQLERQPVNTPQRRDAVLQSYFDDNRLQRLELVDASGEVVFRRVGPAPSAAARPVIERLLLPPQEAVEVPLRSRTGALATASLRIEPPALDSSEVVWRELVRFSALMMAALAVVAGLGLLMVRAVRHQIRELGARVVEARSSQLPPDAQASRSSSMIEPSSLETSRHSVSSVAPPSTMSPPAPTPTAEHRRQVAKLEADLSSQARALDELRRKAHVDALTGLPGRRHFMATLEQALEGETALPAAGVLLLRLRDLAGVNRRVGHGVANQILLCVAKALVESCQQTPGAFAGRLNGSDFALFLPKDRAAWAAGGVLLSRLRPALISLDPIGGMAIGALDLRGRINVKQAIALADEALATAEADVLFAIAAASNSPDQPAFGDSVWQHRLTEALAHKRTVLAGYPVCGRDGRVLHLDCPMRVQFEEGGPYESAWRWLAPATRGRMSADIDQRVVHMALEAIMHDGQSRCVNVASQSMASSEFLVKVTQALEASPDAARRLWIDMPEALALDRPTLVREAARRWRPLGVRLALEHAGENIARIDHLADLGLDCVRVDSRFLNGLTGPESGNVRRHLQSLVRLVHEAGLTITAEGVVASGDLSLVWAIGFDAATGPAVLKRHPSH